MVLRLCFGMVSLIRYNQALCEHFGGHTDSKKDHSVESLC